MTRDEICQAIGRNEKETERLRPFVEKLMLEQQLERMHEALTKHPMHGFTIEAGFGGFNQFVYCRNDPTFNELLSVTLSTMLRVVRQRFADGIASEG